jgi:hypothetical protein
MELDKYLKMIAECPDEYLEIDGEKVHRLSHDFDVYDNFDILLKGDFNKIITDLTKSDFKITNTYNPSPDYVNHMLTNNNGASRLQLRSYPCFNDCWLDFEFLRKQGFNLYAMINFPDQDNRDKFNITFPEMAKTIGIVGNYSKENKLKLAFPRIKDGLGNEDSVFYNPKN